MQFVHLEEPVKTTCSLVWCVLINCCAQNIRTLQLPLVVEVIFQNVLHIALNNNCNKNVEAGVLFEVITYHLSASPLHHFIT